MLLVDFFFHVALAVFGAFFPGDLPRGLLTRQARQEFEFFVGVVDRVGGGLSERSFLGATSPQNGLVVVRATHYLVAPGRHIHHAVAVAQVAAAVLACEDLGVHPGAANACRESGRNDEAVTLPIRSPRRR